MFRSGSRVKIENSSCNKLSSSQVTVFTPDRYSQVRIGGYISVSALRPHVNELVYWLLASFSVAGLTLMSNFDPAANNIRTGLDRDNLTMTTKEEEYLSDS